MPEAGGEAGADAGEVAVGGVASQGGRRRRRRRLLAERIRRSGDRTAKPFFAHERPAESRTIPIAARTAGAM